MDESERRTAGGSPGRPTSEQGDGATPDDTQRRLELLMEANGAILAERTLTDVLHRIVSAARELASARYAALGVLAPDGSLEQFVHDGLDGAAVCPPGQLPRGEGLLGVLVSEPHPLRLERISDDPRSVGLPPTHPRMESFLGVPIEVRGSVYGNLYLTERDGGGGFTAQDESAIIALAATAGIAVENARLYEGSRRREQWAEAAAQVSSSLLDPATADGALGLVADTVLRLTGADVVTVVVPTERSTFRVLLARGVRMGELEGLEYDASRSLAGQALETGRGIRLTSIVEQPRFTMHVQRVMDVGAVLALPLHGSLGSHGVLVVARRVGRAPFEASDLELSGSFASQAAIALELAAARLDQQRLLVLEDRERIARDLHDHVIQRLFAYGLTLEGIAANAEPGTAGRLAPVVEDLDVTIRSIRALIFRLQAPEGARTVRSVVLEAAQQAAAGLGSDPDVGFSGPVDTVADADLVDDVAAVATEALSNVVRHAHAAHVQVSVLARGDLLQVVVGDDGVGPGPGTRRSGLANLEQRALRRGGSCALVARPDKGTELRWSVPLG